MKIAIDNSGFKNKMEDNRELLVPMAILFIAIVLFIAFILPNMLSFPSKKGERDVEVAKLNEIKEAKRVLEAMDKEKLESEIDLVSKTLPSDKNFELILGAISQASLDSNVRIANYLFEDVSIVNPTVESSYSELVFEIGVLGGIDQAASFANALYSSYPVSEVRSISHTNGVSKVTVAFYYKPYVSTDAQSAVLAREKSPQEANALEEILDWNEASTLPEFIEPISTDESATESASPF